MWPSLSKMVGLAFGIGDVKVILTTVARGGLGEFHSCGYNRFFGVRLTIDLIVIGIVSGFVSGSVGGITAGDLWWRHNFRAISWGCGGCEPGVSSNLLQDDQVTLFLPGACCRFRGVRLSASRTQHKLPSIPLPLPGGIFTVRAGHPVLQR